MILISGNLRSSRGVSSVEPSSTTRMLSVYCLVSVSTRRICLCSLNTGMATSRLMFLSGSQAEVAAEPSPATGIVTGKGGKSTEAAFLGRGRAEQLQCVGCRCWGK